MSAKLGVRTVDIGTPQLSMHSIREMCCTTGVIQATRLYKVRVVREIVLYYRVLQDTVVSVCFSTLSTGVSYNSISFLIQQFYESFPTIDASTTCK